MDCRLRPAGPCESLLKERLDEMALTSAIDARGCGCVIVRAVEGVAGKYAALPRMRVKDGELVGCLARWMSMPEMETRESWEGERWREGRISISSFGGGFGGAEEGASGGMEGEWISVVEGWEVFDVLMGAMVTGVTGSWTSSMTGVVGSGGRGWDGETSIGSVGVRICEGLGVSCWALVLCAGLSASSMSGGMFSFEADSNTSSSSSMTASKVSFRGLRLAAPRISDEEGEVRPAADSGLVGLEDSSPASRRSKIELLRSK
jgi:hypothetical protein